MSSCFSLSIMNVLSYMCAIFQKAIPKVKFIAYLLMLIWSLRKQFSFGDNSMIALIKLVNCTPIKLYLKHKGRQKLF